MSISAWISFLIRVIAYAIGLGVLYSISWLITERFGDKILKLLERW